MLNDALHSVVGIERLMHKSCLPPTAGAWGTALRLQSKYCDVGQIGVRSPIETLLCLEALNALSITCAENTGR